MNMILYTYILINIVKILYMSKLVLYFEFLKDTKMVYVQNQNVKKNWFISIYYDLDYVIFKYKYSYIYI